MPPLTLLSQATRHTICSPFPLAPLRQLELTGDRSLTGERSFRRMGSSRRVAACNDDAPAAEESGTSLSGNRSFRRMGSSRRVASCPDVAHEGGEDGSTRSTNNSPSLWGKAPPRISGTPPDKTEGTAEPLASADRALSVPASVWDLQGRPHGQSLSGGEGGGIGPPVEALNRGASFSGSSPFARSASLSRGATSFRRSSVLDAALLPLQSIRVRSSSGWDGENAEQVRPGPVHSDLLLIVLQSRGQGVAFPSNRRLPSANRPAPPPCF